MINRHLHPRRKPRPWGSRVVHKGKAVVVTTQDGQTRMMSSRDAASQLGRSKGGRTAQARGTGHRFTSEEARAAARKLWDKRYPINKRIGARLGRPCNLRPFVYRAPLRLKHVFYYACPPGVYYLENQWVERSNGQTRPIGERTALRRLGYLPYPRKHIVPVTVAPTPMVKPKRGKQPAFSVHRSLLTFRT